jgi:hypothetical protein
MPSTVKMPSSHSISAMVCSASIHPSLTVSNRKVGRSIGVASHPCIRASAIELVLNCIDQQFRVVIGTSRNCHVETVKTFLPDLSEVPSRASAQG